MTRPPSFANTVHAVRYLETHKPVLYEINTRVWLRDLSDSLHRPVTLEEIPEEELARIASLGVDLVWMMGVWQTGERAVEIARSHLGLREEYRRALPDVQTEDIVGSPYSVAEYSVAEDLGGTRGLASLRGRLAKRGVGLILDFVSNHTGVDHLWVKRRPEHYVLGFEEDLRREPGNWFLAQTDLGPRVVAHGRDPYFPGWTDTAQINFRSRSARDGLVHILQSIAGLCDGIRCDMAMLPLEQVFQQVWGLRALPALAEDRAEGEFWSEAIAEVKRAHPRFRFIAEAYWGLEGKLQELGFDQTYDKTLYDRLVHGVGAGVREHFGASLAYQERCTRFIENHDEPRAAAVLPPDRLRAAAVLAAAAPGMLLLHEGQIEGRKVRIPVQLRRRPREEANGELAAFHRRLLGAVADPVFRNGRWRLLPARAAWDGNSSWENFILFLWEGGAGGVRLVTVNYSPAPGQCYVPLAREEWRGKPIRLTDLLGPARYDRQGDELFQKGLYLDVPPFGHHLFSLSAG